MRIFKFIVPVQDSYVVVAMPAGATILSVQNQGGQPALWALVDETARKEPRTFMWKGTGHDCDELADPLHPWKYRATVQFSGGALVFHLFEKVL